MLSCDEALELISAALDGALTCDEQTALDEHLAQCPACSALFDELRGLQAAVADLDEIPAPAGFSAQVMDAIAANPAQEQPDNVIPFSAKKKSHTAWKKWTASAAVIAIVVLGAVTLPGQLGSGNKNFDTASADNAAQAFTETADAGGFFDPTAEAGTACEESAETEYNSTARVTSGSTETENSFASQELLEPQTTFAADDESFDTASADYAGSYCGTITLTSGSLPEGLEAFDAMADNSGTVTYIVPADYFFSTIQAIDTETPAEFTYVLDKTDSDPTAQYGLIIVENPS